jgi:hypothetical protein
MHKQTLFTAMILINVFLGVLFVFSNYYIWNEVNADNYSSPNWNPMAINYVRRNYSNGELVYDGLVSISNYPFWVFWVTMIINISLGIMFLKSEKIARAVE